MTSARRRRALQAYMLAVRDLMRLQAWDITVSSEPPTKSDSLLEITPHEARHNGTVLIGSFFAADRREQRYVVVHELVHLVQAGLWEYITTGTAADVLRPAGLEWITERLRAEMEVQADALARLIAPRMPMPPAWPS